MYLRNIAVIGLASILFSGCVGMVFDSHFDEDAPFLTYKTFDWAPRDAPSPDGEDVEIFRFDSLMRGALFKELTSRAYRHQAFGVADFWVNYRSGEIISVKAGQKAAKHTISGVDNLSVAPRMPPGALVVEIVAPKDGRVLWRGWREGVLVENTQAPSAEFEERVHALAREILHDFPPR